MNAGTDSSSTFLKLLFISILVVTGTGGKKCECTCSCPVQQVEGQGYGEGSECQGQDISDVNGELSCHQSIGKVALNYLSSKTPYHFDSEIVQGYTPRGCSPVRLWYFGRHGTRLPGKGDIKRMKKLLPELFDEINTAIQNGKSQLCPESVAHFKTWRPKEGLSPKKGQFLTPQGEHELQDISKRYQRRFPEIFPPKFDNQTYSFKYTKAQRTEASAKAFAEAIFGPKVVDNVWFPQPEDPDPVLKFYDACKKWVHYADKNPVAVEELNKFEKSVEMNRTRLKVSRRAGLKAVLTLTGLTTIYTTCGFETAWANGTLSPWCVLFDLEDFKVMAYREDLEYFWKDGYGNELNYQQVSIGEVPTGDFLFVDRDYINDPLSSGEKVQAYFSHSGSNLKMLARLGLFNNSMVITSDNFQQTKDLYRWRSSSIDRMASNMAFTLYSCSSMGSLDIPSDVRNGSSNNYQIGFFFQELPTPLPACGGKVFCSFDEFKSGMASIVQNCNFNDTCAL